MGVSCRSKVNRRTARWCDDPPPAPEVFLGEGFYVVMSGQGTERNDVAARVRLVKILGIMGLFDILLGLAAAFVGPIWVPGIDETWAIVGGVVGIAGLFLILYARSIRKRLDAENRSVVR